MSVSLTTITGPVYLPNGATPVGGRVSFELSSWDQEEGAGLVISGPVYTTIDNNGQFSVELYTSTAGVNSVHYRMFVIWEDSELSESYVNDIYVGTPTPHYTKKYIGSFALSGPGPFQVSDLNIISETNNSSFDAYLEMKAFADRIDLGALDAAIQTTEDNAALTLEDRNAVTSLATEALASKVASEAWAQSPTAPDEFDPTSKSSKTWAAEAAGSASNAASSAVEAEVLVNSAKQPSLFAARNVADLLAPVAVPTGLLDTVVLKKLRTDYGECAVYHNFDAGGEWLRQLFTKRFNTGTLGLPRHTLGTVANLYASAAISKPAANNVSETRGTAATVTQASSAATRVGTWSTPATVLTTTDVTWSATIGDTATFSITGVDRIDLRALMAANGGIGKVTIKESGVEIDEANYLLPAGHLVNFLNSATPTTTAHIPLAGGLDTAKTYSVEIKVDVSNPGSNRVYVAGLKGFAALAFNAVGVHGTVFDATLGSVNSAMMLHSGTTIVYEVTGATKIDMRQVVSTVSGIASYKVFDNAGALVESGTHDQYSNSGTVQTSLTVMPDDPKGTFYLHVTSGKTKNAGSTGYRTYATGATRFDKTTAGVAGTDVFDDSGVQSNISNPNTGTDWALISNGNLEQATRITKPGELAATKAYVGGSHAFETVNSIAYAVDGVTVDYAGAAAGAQFVGAREVKINTNSTLLFPSDSSAFATVTHAMKITKLGYSTDTTITTLADAVAFDDFIGMLICPNTQMSGGTWGKSQGGMTGGGFELVAWDQNHLINSYDDGGTIIADPARSMAFVNAEYLVICTINTVTIPDLFKTTPFRAADQFGLVQDRIDNMIKSYFRTFVTDANGALIPAGTTWGYSKHYRTFKGDFRAVLGA